MFKTKITEMLRIQYPLIGGAMMWISDPEFTAAISNAGGMGILASAMYGSPESFADAVDKTLDLTDNPFAVNLNLFPGLPQPNLNQPDPTHLTTLLIVYFRISQMTKRIG